MSEHSYFITGTDTGIGKTWTTLALMQALQKRGQSVIGMKPVAAGCEWLEGQWKNEDALLMQQNSSVSLSYSEINPYAFELPVSPHLACGQSVVDLALIKERFSALQQKADRVLVEGAGGWLSPLSPNFDNAQLARKLCLPVIMVVGLRLGCINHALLTRQAILASGVKFAGWIAVQMDQSMLHQEDNIAYLKQQIDRPLLWTLPYKEKRMFDQADFFPQGI
jgi:dethiobiotin synthetase